MTGELVRIEFRSADASTAAQLTLYTPNGVARTLAADERLRIYDLTISAATGAGEVTVFSDDDDDNAIDAGERMVTVQASAITGDAMTEHIQYGMDGQPGARGIMPHVIAAGAGLVVITGRGGIVNT